MLINCRSADTTQYAAGIDSITLFHSVPSSDGIGAIKLILSSGDEVCFAVASGSAGIVQTSA